MQANATNRIKLCQLVWELLHFFDKWPKLEWELTANTPKLGIFLIDLWFLDMYHRVLEKCKRLTSSTSKSVILFRNYETLKTRGQNWNGKIRRCTAHAFSFQHFFINSVSVFLVAKSNQQNIAYRILNNNNNDNNNNNNKNINNNNDRPTDHSWLSSPLCLNKQYNTFFLWFLVVRSIPKPMQKKKKNPVTEILLQNLSWFLLHRRL